MPVKARRIDSELESLPKAKATFIEPMLLLPTGALPEAAENTVCRGGLLLDLYSD
jgi:hypothetical protein